jgi:hypothetical protein
VSVCPDSDLGKGCTLCLERVWVGWITKVVHLPGCDYTQTSSPGWPSQEDGWVGRVHGEHAQIKPLPSIELGSCQTTCW